MVGGALWFANWGTNISNKRDAVAGLLGENAELQVPPKWLFVCLFVCLLTSEEKCCMVGNLMKGQFWAFITSEGFYLFIPFLFHRS